MINKKLLLFLIGILISNNQGFSQPILEWEKNYGGSSFDYARDIEKTADGGYIVAGWSNSSNGDVGGNYGGGDGWIIKLDNEGNLEWENNYGGSDEDRVSDIKQTADGGYIVAGFSRSNDGDVGGNNGDDDAWIFKLDNEGNLEWGKNYGGSDEDWARDISQTADGGYIFICRSKSNDGDVGGNNGERDYWIVKVDNEGNLEWEKNYGGSSIESPYAFEKIEDGGYIICGSTGSNDGDVGDNNGVGDIWILKVDNEGNLEWEKNYGGSSIDSARDISQTSDGGFVVAGYSKSNDGDVGGNNGDDDVWVFKLDNEGNLEWEKNYGGSDRDWATGIEQTVDGGYIVSCLAISNDGDVGGNNGGMDSWILKLDNEGNLEWENNYGGSNDDVGMEIIETTNNEFIIANWSESDDGDVGGNNGSSDFWIIKLSKPTALFEITNLNPKVMISPNPSNGECIISVNDINNPMNVRIFNTIGHSIYIENEVYGPLSIVNIPKGSYFIHITSDEFSTTRKLIVH